MGDEGERPQQRDAIVYVDVGCRWGFADAWTHLDDAVVVGFDPDSAECARLGSRYAEAAADVRLIPAAVGARPGAAALHVTAFEACSSLYPPNEQAIARHPGLAIMQVKSIETVTLTTLDAWLATSDLDRVDALKLDTQGSELDILTGATGILADVRMLEVEVEFNPLYSGQPLFGDVDRFLRGHRFELWRLKHLTHYEVHRADVGVHVTDRQDYVGGVHDPALQHRVEFSGRGGQLYFADAFYVASAVLAEPTPRDGVIASTFGFGDLAGLALTH